MKTIDKLLSYDSLQEAENFTGKSYKEDTLTRTLGLHLLQKNTIEKEALLDSIDDTKFNETEEEYLRKVTDFGFETLVVLPFTNTHNVEERFYIMFHPEHSILLSWDTFTWEDDGSWAKVGKEVPKPDRNGGNIYFNWESKSPADRRQHSTDCREALKYNIDYLLESGSFLKVWGYQPFMWLLHYMDTNDPHYDYKAINAERIAMLPQDVQNIIKGDPK